MSECEHLEGLGYEDKFPNDPVMEIIKNLQVGIENSLVIEQDSWPEEKQVAIKEAHQAISKMLIEEQEDKANFAQDVLDQFGYNGKSGGLSTLEWAESIIKTFNKAKDRNNG